MAVIKTSVAKCKVDLLESFYSLNEQRKNLEKQLNDLKSELNAEIPGNVYVAGQYVLTRTERSRSMLSEELLVAKLGQELTNHFKKTTNYLVMEVRRSHQ